MPCSKYRPVPVAQALFTAGLCVLSWNGAWADQGLPVGRYLDQNVLVHQAGKLNPLRQVGDLEFSDRITIGEAVRTALSGTGYRLHEPADPMVRTLLESRLAVAHLRFRNKRIDSVIAAIVGTGRGFDLQVDHMTRRLRIVRATIEVQASDTDREQERLTVAGGGGG